MKATGIVRRIDDLGRVVIPKEIRRTLRIREGDPLEIYTENDGEVIFKKYSPMGDLSEFASLLCESLHKTTGATVAVCDRDVVIAASGPNRRELMNRHISSELEQIMELRSVYRQETAGARLPVVAEDDRSWIAVAAPILTGGDLLGCVLFVGTENTPLPGDVEHKLAQTVSGFLGKQMES